MGFNVFHVQLARALLGAAASDSDQPRQASIGFAVGGQRYETLAIGKLQLGPDQHALSELLGFRMRAHDARDGVAVGDRDGRMAERGGAAHIFLRVGGAGEKGEIRAHVELDIGHGRQPPIPCRNQRLRAPHAASPMRNSQSCNPQALRTHQ